jgi:spermidine/putrescine-binding protein
MIFISMITKFINFMKNLFNAIVSFTQRILGNVFNTFKEQSHTAVKVTDLLKRVVESPITDVVVTLIPGDVDDKILAKLRTVIGPVAEKTALAHGILQSSDTNSDVVDAVIQKLKELKPELRANFWVTFSAELNLALADGKISFSEAYILAQLAFLEIRKNR